MDETLAALLADDGVVLLREHPELERAARRLTAAGTVRRVLPGVVVPNRPDDRWVLPRALMRYHPDAVVIGETAAALSFRTHLPSREPVRFATPWHQRTPARAFTSARRRIGPDDITELHGVRVTTAALTALDLSPTDEAAAIDDVLRTGAATLDDLHDTLARNPHRGGNRLRRLLLADSIGRPWSTGDRRLHGLLRDAGITGWRGNRPVLLRTGRWAFLDVAFDDERIDLEVDGVRHHSTRADLDRDAGRQNELVMLGWLPYRITTTMLDHGDELIADLSELLETRRAERGFSPGPRSTPGLGGSGVSA